MSVATAELPDNKSMTVGSKIAALFEMTKARIALMLLITSAAAFYVASTRGFDFVLFANSMVAIMLLAFGVAVLNQYIERDIDPLMERTANRPLPSGRVTPAEALGFGIILCVIAEIYFFVAVNTLTGILGLTVIVGYVLVYTPLKTRTTASTAIGAIPGAMPPLMGWTAATGEITLLSWFLFGTLFLWQFPHFLAIAWMYKEQYRKAGICMLPVVDETGVFTVQQIVLFAVLLLPVSLAPFFFGIAGYVFLTGASILGLIFIAASVKMSIERSVRMARKLLLVSVIYLPLYLLLLVAGL